MKVIFPANIDRELQQMIYHTAQIRESKAKNTWERDFWQETMDKFTRVTGVERLYSKPMTMELSDAKELLLAVTSLFPAKVDMIGEYFDGIVRQAEMVDTFNKLGD